jgi:hypothetical protein
MRNVSDKSYRENQNTHFRFKSFFFFENRAVYEKMWENMVERGRPQMATWRHAHCMLHTRVNKAADTN